jgi:hypothetical protein
LDVVSEDLAMALGTALAEALATFATLLELVYGQEMKGQKSKDIWHPTEQ